MAEKGITYKEETDPTSSADGVAQGPDGSLYLAESVKGKVWRVFYRVGRSAAK